MNMHILAISPGEGLEQSALREVLHSGIDAFMIREPQMAPRALLELARWCCDEAPTVQLWVRGRLDVALAVGCGLHAPEADPDIPLGLLPLSRPLHDLAHIQDRLNSQQLLVSPVFQVPGKGEPLGVAGLHRMLASLPPFAGRVLALGGIHPENVAQLRHPRLDGVALIRALWQAPSPQTLVQQLRTAWNSHA